MKQMMRWMALAMVCGMFLPMTARANWSDNMEEALANAKAQNRFMLLNFTGSDWCGWCIKLDQEVFSKKEFKQYAQNNLQLVVVDFPARKKLSGKLQKQNNELQTKYGVRGYPTILILDPNGEKVAQTGYQPGGPEAYIQHLEKLIAPHAATFGEVSSAPAVSASVPAGNVKALRVWTSSKGSEVEARYEQRIGDNVELRRPDGSVIRIDIPSLSETDQEFLRSFKAIP